MAAFVAALTLCAIVAVLGARILVLAVAVLWVVAELTVFLSSPALTSALAPRFPRHGVCCRSRDAIPKI